MKAYLLPAAVVLALSAPAVADLAPAQGRLLVATPQLQDPNFVEAVILIIAHDEEGTLGLIINRPSEVRPGELFPDLAGAAAYDGRLYLGGPVARTNALALIRAERRPPPEAERVFDGIYASGSISVLADNPGGEARVRLYLGHAGWAPGQLEAEIDWGSWRVLPGEADLVFATAPEELWGRLIPPRREVVDSGYLPLRARTGAFGAAGDFFRAGFALPPSFASYSLATVSRSIISECVRRQASTNSSMLGQWTGTRPSLPRLDTMASQSFCWRLCAESMALSTYLKLRVSQSVIVPAFRRGLGQPGKHGQPPLSDAAAARV